MFKCLDCGAVFERSECVVETHGLECGPYESFHVCPECKGRSYDVAVKCKNCREYMAEIEGDICEECLSDIDTLVKFGAEHNKINHFLLTVYSAEDINSYLAERLKSIMNSTSGSNLSLKATFKRDIEKYVGTYRDEITDFICEKL